MNNAIPPKFTAQVLARRQPLSYNACYQPTVLAIAQRLPAAFFQGEAALNSSRQRRLSKLKVAGRNSVSVFRGAEFVSHHAQLLTHRNSSN